MISINELLSVFTAYNNEVKSGSIRLFNLSQIIPNLLVTVSFKGDHRLQAPYIYE